MTVRKSGAGDQQHLAPLSELGDAKIVAMRGRVEQAVEGQERALKPTAQFPIVGIGASAGGLAAFKAFFSGMPADADPDMAFVLVQHQQPDRKSLLPELVRRFTRMQVFEVQDGMTVLPNCIYVLPSGSDMSILNGTLQLQRPVAPRGHSLPIDLFFRSLALDQHEQAIGILLSGTGNDGTLGVRAIKNEGGLVIVQDPESAEYEGMPCSALATGLVDYQLPPAQMPSRLMPHVAQFFNDSSNPATMPVFMDESALQKIFSLLHAQAGHDFSPYKPGTVHRRIERRMALHQIETLTEYTEYLFQTPVEVEALFQDLLIGVTKFFRDRKAFKALEEQIVPELFAGKSIHDVIRVWVPGCSSGEEAYSIAILLAEWQEAMRLRFKVQVFATDIDSQAIATARAGIYPASIAHDLSPARLKRFFEAEPGDRPYRIQRGIRNMLIFSEHNLIKDPEFSKLDLISCRNLLIYLGVDVQKNIMHTFHRALNPKGFLFLGNSESAAEFSHLFAALDTNLKLYQSLNDAHGTQSPSPGPFSPPVSALGVALPQSPGETAFPVKIPYRELTEQALLQRASATILINSGGNILYFHGRTGRYLEPPLGEAGVNILKMAREGLQRELATALHRAVMGNVIIHHPGLRIKTNGDFSTVHLTVEPIPTETATAPGATLYLVILEETTPDPVTAAQVLDTTTGGSADANPIIARLNQELLVKEKYIQTMQEQLEIFTEELTASNEEMQSVNEELQSTNEELETSKEELISLNEEILSANTELQANMELLSQTNTVMNNMLGGTGIGIIFVDKKLRILRFSPCATLVINLIPGDVGRPLGHTVSNLIDYDGLITDTQAVLNTLQPKKLEVQSTEGKCYTLHIQPYRTSYNVIEGAVLTFTDISEIMQTRKVLDKANKLLRLAVVVRDAHDAITVQDLDGRMIAWNPGAERMYGWSEAEALTMNIAQRIPEKLRPDALTKLHQLSKAQILAPYRTANVSLRMARSWRFG